ncbi:MAG: hypothetical protein JWM16_381, partial [Verrucomicrobiales bacterium]|nr:hypothetical protein [Verrucomicrobiales bacterium]
MTGVLPKQRAALVPGVEKMDFFSPSQPSNVGFCLWATRPQVVSYAEGDGQRIDQSLITGVLPKCQIAEKFLKCPSRVFATEVRHMMSIHKPRPESRCYQ